MSQRPILSRVTRRLIPFAFLCYVVAYIDRVNVGFAASALQRDLGISATDYGIGAGPLLPRLLPVRDPEQPHPRARRRSALDRADHDWLGTGSMATMFVSDVTSFMVARVCWASPRLAFSRDDSLLTYWIPAADAREPARSS